MKCTPFAESTFCPDYAIVHLDNALADSQPQPKTVCFACKPGIDAVKTLKNPLKMLRRDTYAIIPYPDLDHWRCVL